MRFWLGLAIGLVVGSGAMYLGLRTPWRGAPAAVAALPDAAIGSTATPEKRRPRGGKARRGAGGSPGAGGSDEPGAIEDTEPVVLTAADRKLEWQGDAVSLPPKNLDMADDGDVRALDDGEIGAVIRRHGDAVIDCIVTGATGTDLVATVTLKMIVAGNGRVGKLRVHAPRYLFGQGLLGCARRAAARMDFPATGAPTLVTAPFELSR